MPTFLSQFVKAIDNVGNNTLKLTLEDDSFLYVGAAYVAFGEEDSVYISFLPVTEGLVAFQGRDIVVNGVTPTSIEETIKAINAFSLSEGGGEQKQADWNQEDAQQVDYIKNKPDLSEYIKETEERNIALGINKKLLGTVSDGTQYEVAGLGEYRTSTIKNLLEIQIGDNAKGMSCFFLDSEPVDVSKLTGELIAGTRGQAGYFRLYASGSNISWETYFTTGSMGSPVWVPNRWYLQKINVPENMDYIVHTNTLAYSGGSSNWSWEDSTVNMFSVLDQTELGSEHIHVNVNSIDAPTWESSDGKKTFAMVGNIPTKTSELVNDSGYIAGTVKYITLSSLNWHAAGSSLYMYNVGDNLVSENSLVLYNFTNPGQEATIKSAGFKANLVVPGDGFFTLYCEQEPTANISLAYKIL